MTTAYFVARSWNGRVHFQKCMGGPAKEPIQGKVLFRATLTDSEAALPLDDLIALYNTDGLSNHPF